MSGHFDGRNGRLSKTLRNLKRSVGDGLPGKFFFEESPESYLSLSRGAV